ncbi:AlpA family transcriptional regulator [Mesorhizobium sp. M0976]|uniref:helix-turn-helix transcriptional regulator n=1 Tax=unclassified Mesorhizobium TaxID=325217 RepID=UPI00333738A9
MSGADANPNALSLKQTIRRPELRRIVPIGRHHHLRNGTTGEFPQRFYLTPRCVVWSLAEVEAWIEQRRRVSNSATVKCAPPRMCASARPGQSDGNCTPPRVRASW